MNENEETLHLGKERKFDEREREEKNFANKNEDIEYIKECIHQLENSLKDTNDDLLHLFRFLFAG